MLETSMRLSEFQPFVDGLDHPECVTCDPDGVIYAGGEAGQIYRVAPDGHYQQIGSTGGFVLGLCLDGDRNVYACDSAQHAVIRVGVDGGASVFADGDGVRRMGTPNYPVFDGAGNLYVSDSGQWKGNDGCLWVVHPEGETELLSTELTAFPNGLALDPEQRHLYVALSNLPGVVRIPVTDGSVTGPVEEVVRLERHVPDGLAFDAEGALYIACYAPDVIYRLSADGQLERLVEDWERVTLASPTNIAFCGVGRRTLVVASLCRWHLSKAEMSVAGSPYSYPHLPR